MYVTGWHMKGSALPPQVRVSFYSDASSNSTAFYSRAETPLSPNPPRLIQNGVMLHPNTSLPEEDFEFQVPVLVINRFQRTLGGLRVTVTDENGAPVNIDNLFILRLKIEVDYATPAYPDPGQRRTTDDYFITSGRPQGPWN